MPQLVLVKELMVALVDEEDAYGEVGYYLATFEAAIQHIFDLLDQHEQSQRHEQTESAEDNFLF